jgi:soluble lytic murein transglycosylase-like protein
MTIPLERVDRIVDDELDPVAAPLPQAPRSAGSALSVRAPAAAPGPGKVPFAGLIAAAAAEYRIDPALVAAVIRAESNFSAHAVSRKGARGLMQLMPATARHLGVSQSFDPAQNIRGGTAYLSQLASRFGETSVEKVLAAYNAGERAVEEYGGVPPYRETREYVRRVLKFWLEARGTPREAEARVAGPLPAG